MLNDAGSVDSIESCERLPLVWTELKVAVRCKHEIFKLLSGAQRDGSDAKGSLERPITAHVALSLGSL